MSHHILRLAFAGSEDKRRWLLATESALFKLRLESETPEQVSAFMSHHQLTFVPVSAEDRAAFAAPLKAVFEIERSAAAGAAVAHKDDDAKRFEDARDAVTEQYYRVPFVQALELLRSRLVFLRCDRRPCV